MSRRLLWVGEAAYPLHSIARVQTFVAKPDRWGAFTSFLKRLAGLAVAFVVLQLVNEDSGGYASSREDNADVLWGLAVVVAIGLVVHLFVQLAAPSRYALSVETNGPAAAVVTLPEPEQLRHLVGRIVHAIEHPEAEFSVIVERLSVNPRNYHIGDNVNINGGTGHTGVSKA
ncbi:DUF6232 family protein [Streptomyces sp. NPDC090022]|uniref:DUF6232 family protein n=1 Tax=Streptomyces sp. NPDC090022 TaxID=3365920 RepID=UPI0037FA4E0F